MLIKNTTVEARHPWPTDVHVQGGSRGLVIPRGSDAAYTTAFVEAAPPGTFLRGEGPTIEKAEDACWAKYQMVLHCAGGGEHGPFEARQHENGSGFCAKCGAWFSRVLEPSPAYRAESLACETVLTTYGEAIVVSRWWRGLVADTAAQLLAGADGTALPEPTTVPPTVSELEELRREHERPLDLSTLGEVLERMAAAKDDD
jgi:hypothetical protein